MTLYIYIYQVLSLLYPQYPHKVVGFITPIVIVVVCRGHPAAERSQIGATQVTWDFYRNTLGTVNELK